jgi:uncharacterized protein YndB with AHSA1/START domain
MTSRIVRKTIRINAVRMKVWEALTNPVLTREYMFGCDAISDWRVGSSLEWIGAANGRVYVKGNITAIAPGEHLEYTTFDPHSGQKDVAENYLIVRIELADEDGGTRLLVTQGDFATVDDGETRFGHADAGWEMTLERMRKLLEPASA